MRYLFSSSAIALIALVHATPVQAGCSGGVGSTDLSCTSTGGSLADYKTWIETVYAPAAVQALMSSFAAVYSPATSQGKGYGQVSDEWGASTSKNSSFRVDYYQYTQPNTVSTTTTTAKPGSDFIVDGSTLSWYGANVWVELQWVSTAAQTINGITDYIASYTYTVTGNAWANVSQAVSAGGSGTYNLTATPVPGPIAAAGLPAVLGLIGFGLYRRRRNAA